jgi:hypothetical protein
MPRRLPTDHERTLHRVRISANDFMQARVFIEAALARESDGVDSRIDVIHRALVCAAVIYYARPFSPNEMRNPAKRWAHAADSTLDLGPLKNIIVPVIRRRLHRQIIRLRKKVVAHAESRYFEVKMIKAEWPADPKLLAAPFGFESRDVLPAIDLELMRRNANDWLGACTRATVVLGTIVRPGKRLRRPKKIIPSA